MYFILVIVCKMWYYIINRVSMYVFVYTNHCIKKEFICQRKNKKALVL